MLKTFIQYIYKTSSQEFVSSTDTYFSPHLFHQLSNCGVISNDIIHCKWFSNQKYCTVICNCQCCALCLWDSFKSFNCFVLFYSQHNSTHAKSQQFCQRWDVLVALFSALSHIVFHPSFTNESPMKPKFFCALAITRCKTFWEWLHHPTWELFQCDIKGVLYKIRTTEISL